MQRNDDHDDGSDIRVQGIRFRQMQDQELLRDQMRLRRTILIKFYLELIWLLLVIYLFVRVLIIAKSDGGDGLDWRYQFFFVEQVWTIAMFMIIRHKVAKQILRQPLESSTELLMKYRVFRTSTYIIEICLMFWVQDALQIYDEIVFGKGILLRGILYSLYVQIFWYSLIFCFTFPCWLGDRCNNNREQEEEQPLPQQRRTMSIALDRLSRAMDGARFNEHLECSICLADFNADDQVTPLPCDPRHYFHTDCIKEWARVKFFCPLCQKAFTCQQLEALDRRFSIDQPPQQEKREENTNDVQEKNCRKELLLPEDHKVDFE